MYSSKTTKATLIWDILHIFIRIKLNIVQRHSKTSLFRYLGESPQRRLNIEKTNEGAFEKFPQHPSLPVSGKVVFWQPTKFVPLSFSKKLAWIDRCLARDVQNMRCSKLKEFGWKTTQNIEERWENRRICHLILSVNRVMSGNKRTIEYVKTTRIMQWKFISPTYRDHCDLYVTYTTQLSGDFLYTSITLTSHVPGTHFES